MTNGQRLQFKFVLHKSCYQGLYLYSEFNSLHFVIFDYTVRVGYCVIVTFSILL